MNIAVTDHNKILPYGDQEVPPGIVSGIEVTTQEGVHLVVIGPHPRIRKFYAECIQTFLPKCDECYKAAQQDILEIIDGVRKHGCFCMHPHYGGVEGLSIVDPETQIQALLSSSDCAFIEVYNALISEAENNWARSLQSVTKLPRLVAGDAHGAVGQYTGTFSALPVDRIPDGDEPLVSRVLRAMHDHPQDVECTTRATPHMEFLRTAWHIICSNKIRSLAAYCWKRSGRMVGLTHAPNERTIHQIEKHFGSLIPDRA